MEDNEIIKFLEDPTQHERVFRYILKTYKEKVYYHVRKIVLNHDDADDVTQETFIKIWRNLDKYRGEAKLYTWIYKIATNESFTFLRKNKKGLSVSFDQDEGLSNTIPDTEPHILLDGENIAEKLKNAIETLSEKQRVIFNLKYYEELTYEEISEIIEISVGGLKSMYHLAVKKIERYLEKIN
ncbi:MAG: RNA polymerase sigma factor [Leadbetterella sp.]